MEIFNIHVVLRLSFILYIRTGSQVDEQRNSSPLTVPNPDVLDTAKISQEVLRMLQGSKIPIAQFGFHVLERSQGRTSEILNKPKAFEKLSEEGKEVYRKMKEWLQQKDGIDDIRGKMQGTSYFLTYMYICSRKN